MRKVKQIGSLALAVLILLAMIGCNQTDPANTVPPATGGSLQGQVTGPTTEVTIPSSTPAVPDPTTLPTDPSEPSEPVPTTDPTQATEPATTPSEPQQPSDPTVPSSPSGNTGEAQGGSEVQAGTQPTEPPTTVPVTTTPAPTEHTHSYTSTVIAPTCSTQGYTRHTCSCGHSYDDNHTAADPNAHSYVKNVRQPTCALDGVTYYVCSGCGDRYLDDSTFVPPLAHTPNGETGQVVAPTVWHEGYTIYTCSVCGQNFQDDFVKPDDILMQNFLRDAAAYTIQYINQYRVEQGGTVAEVLPGLTVIAEERADQLLTDYSHDNTKLRALCNKYEYGKFVDGTLYGGTQQYYTFGGAEAIAKSNRVSPSAEELGKAFAASAKNSAGHWRYVGDSKNCYIAVSIEYDAAAADGFPWKCCILLTDTNYG